MVKELDLSLDYKVKDLNLADFGRKEMQLSEREMPGLMECIRKYGPSKHRFPAYHHPDGHAHQDAL